MLWDGLSRGRLHLVDPRAVVDILRCRIDEIELALCYAHVRRVRQASVGVGLEVACGINGATQELLERVRAEVIGVVHRVSPVDKQCGRGRAGLRVLPLLERAVSLLDVGVGSRRCPSGDFLSPEAACGVDNHRCGVDQ